MERIDCCHSEVHRHIFYRDRPESRRGIRELFPGDERILGDEFVEAYADLVEHWIDKYERWKR